MKKWYADIIVDISQEKLDRTFQYEIPQNLLGIIKTGTKVISDEWTAYSGLIKDYDHKIIDHSKKEYECCSVSQYLPWLILYCLFFRHFQF